MAVLFEFFEFCRTFFGVWAWKLTDLCHSSAPCFWIGQRVPLLLIVLKIYDRPWRCEMDSWLGVSKYPFFGLFFERFRPMLWKIECFCDHCYLLNWYGVFLMSWHLFDEFLLSVWVIFSTVFSPFSWQHRFLSFATVSPSLNEVFGLFRFDIWNIASQLAFLSSF